MMMKTMRMMPMTVLVMTMTVVATVIHPSDRGNAKGLKIFVNRE